MSTIKSSAENLTLNADGANNDIIFQSNGSTKLTLQGSDGSIGMGLTTLDATDVSAIFQLNDNYGIGFGDGNGTRPDFQILTTNGNALGFICGNGSATQDIVMLTSGVLCTPQGIELGSGIDGTAANTLDDYEEGTWTPQVKIDGSTTGITHDAQAGVYTKIGNTVILTAVLAISSKGSETGSVTFANFPFTIENWTATSSLDGGSASFGYYGGTSGISSMGAAGQGGTTTAQVYRQASDQSQLNDVLTNSQILDGFSTRWTLIFQTTS